MKKLREIAHTRTGDKGNISNISVIVYQIEDYKIIERELTVERIKKWFSGIVLGEVQRYELPQLGALNFVLNNALGGGVTRSLALDMHGKTLGAALLELDIKHNS